MPKIQNGGPAQAKTPTIAPAEKPDPEDRLEELHRKLQRLNREAELLAKAMKQKPKKS